MAYIQDKEEEYNEFISELGALEFKQMAVDCRDLKSTTMTAHGPLLPSKLHKNKERNL